MKTLSKLPEFVLLPAAHAPPFNGACKCRLPEGLCELRSQVLSYAQSERQI